MKNAGGEEAAMWCTAAIPEAASSTPLGSGVARSQAPEGPEAAACAEEPHQGGALDQL